MAKKAKKPSSKQLAEIFTIENSLLEAYLYFPKDNTYRILKPTPDCVGRELKEQDWLVCFNHTDGVQLYQNFQGTISEVNHHILNSLQFETGFEVHHKRLWKKLWAILHRPDGD